MASYHGLVFKKSIESSSFEIQEWMEQETTIPISIAELDGTTLRKTMKNHEKPILGQIISSPSLAKTLLQYPLGRQLHLVITAKLKLVVSVPFRNKWVQSMQILMQMCNVWFCLLKNWCNCWFFCQKCWFFCFQYSKINATSVVKSRRVNCRDPSFKLPWRLQ